MKRGDTRRFFAGCDRRYRSDLGLCSPTLGAGAGRLYIDDIYDACRSLASGARRGRPVDVRPGYLKLTAGSHMIYFRPNAGRIEVVRILHFRQDVDVNL